MDTEKNNNEKKVNVKVLLIILIILVLCLIGLVVYKMLVFDKKSDENTNNNGESSSYEVADKLYSEFLSLKHLCGGFRFPDLNDISARMLFAYDSIDSKLVKKFNFNGEKSYDKCITNSKDDECLLETVKVSDFEKKYKDLFGSNSKIDYSSLPDDYAVKNGNINQYFRIFGCEGGVDSYSILEKYEEENDNLILYVNTFEIEGPSEHYDELLEYFNKDGIDSDNDGFIVSYDNDSLTDKDKKKLFEYFKNDIVSYKLIFSKDVNGNYYFSSVQKI